MKQALAYVVTVILVSVLTFTLAPAKVLTKTIQSPAPTAPAYASEFMRAYCARDVETIIKFVKGVPAETIREYEAARAGTPRCIDPQFFGSFRTQDVHIFTAFDGGTGAEYFWVVTFEGGLVVNIE